MVKILGIVLIKEKYYNKVHPSVSETKGNLASLLQEMGKYEEASKLFAEALEIDKNLYLASRNLYKVDVRDAAAVDPVSLIGFDKVLMTVPALKKVEGMLA